MKDLSEKDIESIKQFLETLEDPNSLASQSYRAILDRQQKIIQPQLDAIAESKRLTAEDFAIVINATD